MWQSKVDEDCGCNEALRQVKGRNSPNMFRVISNCDRVWAWNPTTKRWRDSTCRNLQGTSLHLLNLSKTSPNKLPENINMLSSAIVCTSDTRFTKNRADPGGMSYTSSRELVSKHENRGLSAQPYEGRAHTRGQWSQVGHGDGHREYQRSQLRCSLIAIVKGFKKTQPMYYY